jgi:hypothetical protein
MGQARLGGPRSDDAERVVLMRFSATVARTIPAELA